MTSKTRAREIVDGLDALRAYHGHVSFCPECAAVIETALHESMPIADVKILFCSVGRSAFRNAFLKTGGKRWGVSIVPTPSRNNNPPKEASPAPDSTPPTAERSGAHSLGLSVLYQASGTRTSYGASACEATGIIIAQGCVC